MHKIVERYSHSVISSNLRNDERHSEPDILAAVALTSSFAGLLFRVKYANDAASYKQLRIEWIDRVTEKADLNHWPTQVLPWRLAVDVLNHWLNDRCGPCGGLGYQKHEHAPVLSDVTCHICGGAGTLEFKCGSTEEKYAFGLLDDLQALAVVGGAEAMRKFANEIDSMFTAYVPGETVTIINKLINWENAKKFK